ncbi:hypothetical protein L1049_018491 [Liquidambar formosana]|uniref:SWIM-type domain-containing protein n=1 Tax=Liquidambar formosana TaxID=63359 RepID=A0AAP0RA60_LIQFO
MLSKYCHHEPKILLTANWAQAIREVGQSFEGGVNEFRRVLKMYSMEVGFEYDLVKNTKERIIAIYKRRNTNNCMWHVYATLQKINGYFYIRTLNNVHTCGAAVRTTKNSRMSSELVASLIRDKVRDKPLTRPTDVVYDFKVNYGLDITYHHAWWGVERAKNELFGHQSLSFDLLRWYKEETERTNPGSIIEIDYDSNTGHFKRVFVSFYACIYGFWYCRPMLFLDGTFLKGRYKGNLLAATAKDGDQGLFPLAFTIVDSEDEDNWYWFLTHLSNVLSREDRPITFVSNRHRSIVNAIPAVFPNSYHAYCLHHLKGNLRDKLSGCPNSFKEMIIKKFSDCAYAPSPASFHSKINQLRRECGDKVRTFLDNLLDENWANAYFMGQRYGEMWSNAAESFNSQIREARHFPIIKLIDAIRVLLMNQMTTRREISRNWPTVLYPKIDSRLEEEIRKGRTWIVRSSGQDIFEVQSYPSVSVDIQRRTCSCYQWQINGFPCAHAAQALQKSGKNLLDYVERYFHTWCYFSAYSQSVFPIPTVGIQDYPASGCVIRPPSSKKQPGRPKKKRIPSKGEKVNQIRCGRCNKIGNHNKKTCKEPI